MSNYRIIGIPEEITLTLKDIATALRRSEDEVWFGDATRPVYDSAIANDRLIVEIDGCHYMALIDEEENEVHLYCPEAESLLFFDAADHFVNTVRREIRDRRAKQ
jgi:hypothetical protein